MTDSPFWLAVGAFVTSAGFGAVTALGAAWVAYLGLGKRIRAERELAVAKADEDRESALEGDRRKRWWTVLTWLWDNRDTLGEDTMMQGLVALKTGELTVEQATMLQVVTAAAVLKEDAS